MPPEIFEERSKYFEPSPVQALRGGCQAPGQRLAARRPYPRAGGSTGQWLRPGVLQRAASSRAPCFQPRRPERYGLARPGLAMCLHVPRTTAVCGWSWIPSAPGRLVSCEISAFLNNLKDSSSICLETPNARFRLAHLRATVAFGWLNELFMSPGAGS